MTSRARFKRFRDLEKKIISISNKKSVTASKVSSSIPLRRMSRYVNSLNRGITVQQNHLDPLLFPWWQKFIYQNELNFVFRKVLRGILSWWEGKGETITIECYKVALRASLLRRTVLQRMRQLPSSTLNFLHDEVTGPVVYRGDDRGNSVRAEFRSLRDRACVGIRSWSFRSNDFVFVPMRDGRVSWTGPGFDFRVIWIPNVARS